MQPHFAIGTAVTIHHNVIELIGRHRGGELAEITLRKSVIVAGDQGQIGQAVSGVNCQERIEIGICRGEKQRAVDRSTQLIPDRMSALVAGVQGLARLARRAFVHGGDHARKSGQFNRIAEIIVGRIDEADHNRVWWTDIACNVLREGAHGVGPGGQQDLTGPVRCAADCYWRGRVDLQEDLADASVVQARVFGCAHQSDHVGCEERFTRGTDDGDHWTIGVRSPPRRHAQTEVPHSVGVVPGDGDAVRDTCPGVKIDVCLEPINRIVD